MNKYNSYVNGYRYLIMTGVMAGTLLKIPQGKYSLFIFGMLVFILNTQLRIMLDKHLFLLSSIILDVLIGYWLFLQFSGYTPLILLVTLIDIMLKLREEAYTLTCVITIAYGYCIITSYPLDTSFIYIMFYLVAFLMLLHLRRELFLKTNAEGLYDQLRESNYELEAARSRLLDYSRQVEKITKLEERNRISRELHDSIGHSLTGILMQVDAAKQIIEVDRKKGVEILESAYKNINASIENVRRTVRKLRPSEYQTHSSSIIGLINKFKNATGVNVEYRTSGIPYEIFPSIEMVLYRNIQEALTNSVRHGHATHISVHIIFKPDYTEAVVSDNGRGCGELKKGFGLSGMEERLEIIGGSIKYNTEKGFSIHMVMPRREL